MVEKDSLPLKLLPYLKKVFPDIKFIQIDPNENFTPPIDEPLYIIDTVVGIEDVVFFKDLDSFSQNRSVSPHDYDLLTHLLFLRKLNKLPPELFIIGVPSVWSKNGDKKEAYIKIEKAIKNSIYETFNFQ